MNREQILELIRNLAQSQGFYGRLLEELYYNEKALEYLENQHFQDSLDLILFLEL